MRQLEMTLLSSLIRQTKSATVRQDAAKVVVRVEIRITTNMGRKIMAMR